MKRTRLILLVFTSIVNLVFAQGDDCSNAVDLGTLPVPNACSGGNPAQYGLGAAITENGSTVGSMKQCLLQFSNILAFVSI